MRREECEQTVAAAVTLAKTLQQSKISCKTIDEGAMHMTHRLLNAVYTRCECRIMTSSHGLVTPVAPDTN